MTSRVSDSPDKKNCERRRKMDWAQKTIRELEDVESKDDCVRYFREYYKAGDSQEACEKYNAAAREVITVDGGQNYLIIFPDGSGYADWRQGIDAFYPDASEALTEEEWKELER